MIKSVTATNHLGESLKMELMNPEPSGLVIKSINGLGPVKADLHFTELATIDGSLDNDAARISSRDITINLIFLENPTIEDTRLLSYKYFSPKKYIKLTIETDKRTVYCTGKVESNEPAIFSKQEGCQISIECPDPNFYKDVSDAVNMYGVEPLFEFPFESEIIEETIVNNALSEYIPEAFVIKDDNDAIDYALSCINDDSFVNMASYKASVIVSNDNPSKPIPEDAIPHTQIIPSWYKEIGHYLFSDDISSNDKKTNAIIAVNNQHLFIVDAASCSLEVITRTQAFYAQLIRYSVIFAGEIDSDDPDFYMFSSYPIITDEDTINFVGNYISVNDPSPVHELLIMSGEEVPEWITYWTSISNGPFGRRRKSDGTILLDDGFGRYYVFMLNSDDCSSEDFRLGTISVTERYYYYKFNYLGDALDPNTQYSKINRIADSIIFGNIPDMATGIINYNGEIESGVIITLHAIGEISGLTLYKIEDKSIMKINDDRFKDVMGTGIKSGDSIIIDTRSGKKSMSLYRNGQTINIINALDRPINWFKLTKGPNSFYYDANKGLEYLEMTVDYQEGYSGV